MKGFCFMSIKVSRGLDQATAMQNGASTIFAKEAISTIYLIGG